MTKKEDRLACRLESIPRAEATQAFHHIERAGKLLHGLVRALKQHEREQSARLRTTERRGPRPEALQDRGKQ